MSGKNPSDTFIDFCWKKANNPKMIAKQYVPPKKTIKFRFTSTLFDEKYKFIFKPFTKKK